MASRPSSLNFLSSLLPLSVFAQHVTQYSKGPLIWADYFGKTKTTEYGKEFWNQRREYCFPIRILFMRSGNGRYRELSTTSCQTNVCLFLPSFRVWRWASDLKFWGSYLSGHHAFTKSEQVGVGPRATWPRWHLSQIFCEPEVNELILQEFPYVPGKIVVSEKTREKVVC